MTRRPAWLGALGAVLFVMVLHYGYKPFLAEDRAQVWNILGSAARLAEGAVIAALLRVDRAALRRYALAAGAVAWWVAEEGMVIGCSAAYIVSPWEVLPGQDQCSALLDFDLGKIGALVGSVLLVLILRRGDPAGTCKS